MKQDVDIVIKLKENQQMNNNEIYMREAYKEALKAYKKNEVPIGCVIVHPTSGEACPYDFYFFPS